MLSQTNSAGVDQGTIHYTHTPDGMLVSQRVPGASNYYYLLDADGSVIRMVDKSGNVLATYDYCPTGNAPGDLVMTTIAQNNPYRYLGRYYDAGTKMYYDGHYIDSNSGNAIQLCPLPFGAISLPCLAPLSVSTPAETYLPPVCFEGTNDPQSTGVFGTEQFLRVSGPERAKGFTSLNCHVNVQAGSYNLHVSYDEEVDAY